MRRVLDKQVSRGYKAGIRTMHEDTYRLVNAELSKNAIKQVKEPVSLFENLIINEYEIPANSFRVEFVYYIIIIQVCLSEYIHEASYVIPFVLILYKMHIPLKLPDSFQDSSIKMACSIRNNKAIVVWREVFQITLYGGPCIHIEKVTYYKYPGISVLFDAAGEYDSSDHSPYMMQKDLNP